MKTNGKLIGITKDYRSEKLNITFEIDGCSVAELDRLKAIEKLEITADKPKTRRTNDANALLWACIGDIALAMTPPVDKWDVYLALLKRYGQYTYICVKPKAVEAMKRQWRACEEVGEVEINGKKSIQMLCYFGSSSYTPDEFRKLLDGVISEMEEIGIPKPIDKELKRVMKQYEKEYEKHNNR